MPTTLEFTGTTSDQYQRQIGMGVAIPVGDAAAIEDHRMIEQSPVAIRSGFHTIDQISELIYVMGVDLDGFRDLIGIVLVVRAIMMTVGNTDVAVAAIA